MAKIYVGVGHGGPDPGAVSGNHRESLYALDIASACTAELRRHGMLVLQSRTSDVAESAAAKIAECNTYAPDLALDIHLNAGGGDGLEVYHAGNGGKGKDLAQSIETAVKAIGQNSRGIKTKFENGRIYFGIIRQTNCPTVLVECAFIDSDDVKAVDTIAERQDMGRAIAHGVLAFLGVAVKLQTSSKASEIAKRVAVYLPQLQRGCTGDTVKAMQRLLIGNGISCGDAGADGDFGSGTLAAVKQFQLIRNLTVDGIVGAKTWAALLG
ncbi:MAG: N-acetylmuramoyl-L-alanine amidase [Alistipes sp.]|nr:N-acetylmuramoyl-L-alanine amidase [Alistipes sp.]